MTGRRVFGSRKGDPGDAVETSALPCGVGPHLHGAFHRELITGVFPGAAANDLSALLDDEIRAIPNELFIDPKDRPEG